MDILLFYPQLTRVRHMKKALIIMLSVILTAGFAFVIDGVTYKMKNKNPSGVWTLSENGQKVVDAMKNAKSTLMKFTFKKAVEITYKLDGRKFAECYEAAKTIPVV